VLTFLDDVDRAPNEDSMTALKAHEIGALFWSRRQAGPALLNGG